jgi:hypothetical protein
MVSLLKGTGGASSIVSGSSSVVCSSVRLSRLVLSHSARSLVVRNDDCDDDGTIRIADIQQYLRPVPSHPSDSGSK